MIDSALFACQLPRMLIDTLALGLVFLAWDGLWIVSIVDIE
jgi:hypothetical protein